MRRPALAFAFVLSLASPAAADAAFVPAPGSPFSAGADAQVARMSVGDIDGDGALDVATANNARRDTADGRISLLRGDGTGRVGLAPGYPRKLSGIVYPSDALAADLNHDGKAEVVVSGYIPTTLSGGRFDVFTDGVDGLSLASTGDTEPGDDLRLAGSADMNGDGNADVIAWSHLYRDIWVLAGDGESTPALTPIGPTAVGGYPLQIVDLALGDFNGDGHMDVAAACERYASSEDFGGLVVVMLNDGKGGLSAAPGSPIDVSIGYPAAIATGDFDGDGHPDVVVSGGGVYKQMTTLLGAGDGGFTATPASPVAMPASFAELRAARVDGDEATDLVAAGWSREGLWLLHGDGHGAFTPSRRSPFGTYANDISLGDFSTDGHPDVASRGNGVAIWLKGPAR